MINFDQTNKSSYIFIFSGIFHVPVRYEHIFLVVRLLLLTPRELMLSRRTQASKTEEGEKGKGKCEESEEGEERKGEGEEGEGKGKEERSEGEGKRRR